MHSTCTTHCGMTAWELLLLLALAVLLLLLLQRTLRSSEAALQQWHWQRCAAAVQCKVGGVSLCCVLCLHVVCLCVCVCVCVCERCDRNVCAGCSCGRLATRHIFFGFCPLLFVSFCLHRKKQTNTINMVTSFEKHESATHEAEVEQRRVEKVGRCVVRCGGVVR